MVRERAQNAQGIVEAIEIGVARLTQLGPHIVRDAACGKDEERGLAGAAANGTNRRSNVRHLRLGRHQIDQRADRFVSCERSDRIADAGGGEAVAQRPGVKRQRSQASEAKDRRQPTDRRRSPRRRPNLKSAQHLSRAASREASVAARQRC